MMSYQWIVPLGAALGNLGLGTLVLIRGRGAPSAGLRFPSGDADTMEH